MALFDFKFSSSIYNVTLKSCHENNIKCCDFINPRENEIMNFITEYSFGIYLIHCFWLNISNKGLHIYPGAFPPVVGEFGIFAVVLAASIVSSMIMYGLPGFGKILGVGGIGCRFNH